MPNWKYLIAAAVLLAAAYPALSQTTTSEQKPKPKPKPKTEQSGTAPAFSWGFDQKPKPKPKAAETPAAPVTPVTTCRNTGSFDRWLADFRKEALEQGINQRTLNAVSSQLTFEQSIINRDRGQRVFSQGFLQFSDRMAAGHRIKGGQAQIQKHAALFRKVEEQYGVPGPVIASFWGLETDFGGNIGNITTLPSLATLAFDCRRSELFRKELMSALKIVQRGDLTVDQMMGSWAGELGQTQFLPSHYFDYGVDFDGDGKVNLLRSVPDVIASTANYIRSLGWKAGEPWMHEVRVPAKLAWDQADLAIRHPRSQWAQWGVRQRDGQPLDADDLPASLLLPMGRFGPAFLVYENFRIFPQWNNSLTYSTTASFLATRIAGAGPMSRGKEGLESLSFEEIRELQRLLVKRGYDVGKVDGIPGAATRAAVKDVQMQLKLPADSYPTPELLSRLRGGREASR